ncbi:MAG: hypothetical protein WDW38_000454 [Sanguina aurantia]
MRAHIVTLPGDGVGPEVTAAAVAVLKAVAEHGAHEFTFEEHAIGGVAIDTSGEPLPAAALAACQSANAVLLGAVGGPKWSDPNARVRPEQGLLALRAALGVYANLRPLQVHPALADLSPLKNEKLKGVDVIFVRELTGGAYFGAKTRTEDTATDECKYTVVEIERVVRRAFVLAQGRRHQLTSVDKANVLETSRLWRSTVQRIAPEYPDVTVEHQLVDSMAMLLLTQPSRYDVVVTENLFGDILTDEAAALAGSLGLLPSASLGDGRSGLYEPIHGSAPDIAGKGIANPVGAILSAAMLLRHSLQLEAEAVAIEAAVDEVLHAGPRTRDIGGDARTDDVRDAVLAALAAQLHASAGIAGRSSADRQPATDIKKGPDRAPARAMLRATGLDDAAIAKPLVAIVHTWSNVSPCNLNLRELAEHAAAGIRAAGGTPIEFNTIAVTDGIAMGTSGMRASLISREVITDSIELAVDGHCLDAMVVLSKRSSGHANARQKIQYHLRLKLELEELRHECTLPLKERFRAERVHRAVVEGVVPTWPTKNAPASDLLHPVVGGTFSGLAEAASVRSAMDAVLPDSLAQSSMFATPIGQRTMRLSGRGRSSETGTVYSGTKETLFGGIESARRKTVAALDGWRAEARASDPGQQQDDAADAAAEVYLTPSAPSRPAGLWEDPTDAAPVIPATDRSFEDSGLGSPIDAAVGVAERANLPQLPPLLGRRRWKERGRSGGCWVLDSSQGVSSAGAGAFSFSPAATVLSFGGSPSNAQAAAKRGWGVAAGPAGVTPRARAAGLFGPARTAELGTSTHTAIQVDAASRAVLSVMPGLSAVEARILSKISSIVTPATTRGSSAGHNAAGAAAVRAGEASAAAAAAGAAQGRDAPLLPFKSSSARCLTTATFAPLPQQQKPPAGKASHPSSGPPGLPVAFKGPGKLNRNSSFA